ncbi:MAG TPA: winged helix DNA-binding domain-containing protein [Actinomycetes bacterium]|nr:winged helix DNA-binding domain-containing protein [Actinomycetes bacterium]
MAATATPAARLRWPQVMAWRAARHHLEERLPAKAMLEVVADIAGLHAQVLSSAELTLWARVEGLEPDAVRQALWEERSLVKTWAMRGTLHLLPAAEFPRWQAARSTTRLWEAGAWQRGFGITLKELERLNDAVAEALDGQLLTREELASRVGELTGSKRLGDKLRESWGALLKPAAALGLLCFAPSKGQQVRFTRPDTWLGGWTGHDPDEAMDEVTRRFLAASGPVTREDFARWWGIPSPARGARLLQRLGEEVARVEVEGMAAYALAADLPGLAKAGGRGKAAGGGPRTVRLLPAFDQYVVTATRQAEHLMPGPFKARVYRPQGWLSPVLLVGGRMDGIWRQEASGKRLLVTIEPFAGPPPAWARRAAEAEAERLAAFTGGPLELRWADPASPGGAAKG